MHNGIRELQSYLVKSPAAMPLTVQYDWSDWQTYVCLLVLFLLWWTLVDLPRCAWLKFDKPTASLMSAAILVLVGVVDAQSAVASIEFGTVLLLFGLFVILEYLEYVGVIHVITDVLEYGNPSPVSLLVRVSFASGLVAALIMNDGAAVFLSKIVNDLCDRQQLSKVPFFLALATSANIGSAATVLGNPKNMLIHASAHINFVDFSYHMIPPALFGLILNSMFIVLYCRSSLPDSGSRRGSSASSVSQRALLGDQDVESGLIKERKGKGDSSSSSSSSSSDEEDKAADFRLKRQANRMYRRRKQQLSSIVKDKLIFSRTPKEIGTRSSRALVDERKRGLQDKLRESEDSSEATKSRVNLTEVLSNMNTNDDLGGIASSSSKAPDAVSVQLEPLNLSEMFDFAKLRRNWEETEAFVRDDANREENYKLQSKKATGGFVESSPKRRQLRMQGAVRGLSDRDGDGSEITPLLSSRRISYLATHEDKQQQEAARLTTDKKKQWWNTVVEFLQETAPKISICCMYLLFALGFPLGWTCLLTSMGVVILSGIPPERLYRNVNFTLLFYIIGLFVTICAVNKTPLANVFWNIIQPLATSDDVVIAVLGFSAFTFVICFIVTSIPCVLIIVPHLVQLNGPIKGFSWLLLALCVTLCGNLTPSSSITGYIVCDYMVKNDPDNVIDFKQWAKFSIPTTIVIMLAGSTFLDFNL